MSYKFVFVIIVILNNFIWPSVSLNISIIEDEISALLKPFTDLASLPKNYKYTDEELQESSQKYSEGLVNEDIFLNGTQLIKKYGYDVEEHYVITSDGYELALYRIPSKGNSKGVIFLMHALLAGYIDWLTVGADKALPFILSDLGYDVWMGNGRGTVFSKNNIYLSPSDSEYWNFSWDEMGRYDLPAMIDYVLEKTGEDTLTYVGHSQGTTAFFVLCSEKPEYNEKINLMVAFGPVAWLKNVVSPLLKISARSDIIRYVFEAAAGLDGFPPDSDLRKTLSFALCGNVLFASTICQSVVFLLWGFDYAQTDFKQLPVFFNHFPSGGSRKQYNHYTQLVSSGFFRKFDYGVIQNMVEYGSASPPSYAVDKITAPVALYYGANDWLADPADVEILRSNLPNVVEYYEVSLKSFNHADFLLAKDVKSLLHDRVTTLISEYAGKKFN